MSPLLEFIKDSGSWGVGSVLAAFLFFGISLWEHAHGKSISAFGFLCLSIPLFWAGSLVAWNRKRKEVARLYKPNDCPIVRICAWGSQNNDQPPFGFFLQNHGGGAAHELSLEQFRVSTYTVTSRPLAVIRNGIFWEHSQLRQRRKMRSTIRIIPTEFPTIALLWDWSIATTEICGIAQSSKLIMFLRRGSFSSVQ
jgi:hypothetical protein